MPLTPPPGNFSYQHYAADADFLLVSDANCPFCRKAKDFLATTGIRVVVIEAPGQLARQQRPLGDLGIRGVPVLVTKSGYLRGFDEGQWQRLITQIE